MWHTKSVRHFSRDCGLQVYSPGPERDWRYRTACSRSPGKIWNWNQQKRSIQFPLYAWFNWKSRPPFLCLSISLTSQAVLFLRRYAKWSMHSTTGCHNGRWRLLFDYRKRRKRERKRFLFLRGCLDDFAEWIFVWVPEEREEIIIIIKNKKSFFVVVCFT